MPTNLAIAGAGGRMGRRIIALATADPDVTVVAALERAGSPHLGADAGELAGVGKLGLPIAESAGADFDALIDFTTPDGARHWLAACRDQRRPYVTGVTGFVAADESLFTDAARNIPVLKAANMSIGVNVLLRVAKQLGELLDTTYDVEIVEAHHRHKTDAPSGTALAFCDAVVAGRAATGSKDSPVVHGRSGRDLSRPAGEIGIHALRTGETPGEHTVRFGGPGETISIAHVAHSRDTFAAGAIRAARWIVTKPPGRYDMQDVLFGA